LLSWGTVGDDSIDSDSSIVDGLDIGGNVVVVGDDVLVVDDGGGSSDWSRAGNWDDWCTGGISELLGSPLASNWSDNASVVNAVSGGWVVDDRLASRDDVASGNALSERTTTSLTLWQEGRAAGAAAGWAKDLVGITQWASDGHTSASWAGWVDHRACSGGGAVGAAILGKGAAGKDCRKGKSRCEMHCESRMNCQLDLMSD